MSEPRGLQSRLAIEAVRWSPGSGGELVVRVAGRWRDARRAGTVRPVLVVDTEHDRYRFPALSEAPSGPGADSGLLPICFTLPAWLAPYLGGRLTLLVGSVSMALPPAIADGGALGGERVNGGDVLRGGEFPVGEVRAGRVATLVDRLELELDQARRDAQRLRAELESAERERCQAEQLAHAEAAIRVDHEARMEHHRADARAVLALHQAAQIHARRIRDEIESMRRALEEEARADPAGPREGSSRRPGSRTRAGVLAAELALAEATPGAPLAAVVPAAAANPGLALELAMRARPAETRPGRHGPGRGDVTDVIDGIARQLDEVRDAVALLPALREPERPAPEPDPQAEAVVPDRLTAALERLRGESAPTGRAESAPTEAEPLSSKPTTPGEPAVAARSSRWLLPALRRLAREDPARAGVVITHLLAAQSLVVAGPVRYDVVLSDLGGCRSVTVSADGVRLELFVTPRPLEGVAFRVEGDLAGFGRLLVYGRLRRRLSRRVARVRGDRRAFAALVKLIREPFALPALYAAGVRLDPELTLRLVAEMIDPAWTAGERFTIGYESIHDEDRVYLHVRDRARVRVTREPPLGPVATTIRSPGDELFALLAGVDDAEIELRGASEPVTLVREWIARAQRDS